MTQLLGTHPEGGRPSEPDNEGAAGGTWLPEAAADSGLLLPPHVALKLLSSVAVAIHDWHRGSWPLKLEICFLICTKELLASGLWLRVS